MAANIYPQLVIVDNELDIAADPQQQSDLLFHLGKEQLNDVLLLTSQFKYVNLAGEIQPPATPQQLASWVTAYLEQEGHCCLAKINELTPAQAFQLLAID